MVISTGFGTLSMVPKGSVVKSGRLPVRLSPERVTRRGLLLASKERRNWPSRV
jgi:hypothetical protein